MPEKIKIEVVTPQKYVISEEAQMVVCPGIQGEFGILVGHTPFLSALKVGAVRYVDANGTERQVFVSGGFAEALPNKVTILAESAERRRDIDVERAKNALARAQKRLEGGHGDSEDVDDVRARAALSRAMHRLKVVSVNM